MTIKVSIYEAKINLSKLVKNVIEGEEIIIVKSGKPVARLIPINKKIKKREPGLFKGKISYSDDVNQPLQEESIKDFYK